jgi:hypothetical protein
MTDAQKEPFPAKLKAVRGLLNFTQMDLCATEKSAKSKGAKQRKAQTSTSVCTNVAPYKCTKWPTELIR